MAPIGPRSPVAITNLAAFFVMLGVLSISFRSILGLQPSSLSHISYPLLTVGGTCQKGRAEPFVCLSRMVSVTRGGGGLVGKGFGVGYFSSLLGLSLKLGRLLWKSGSRRPI